MCLKQCWLRCVVLLLRDTTAVYDRMPMALNLTSKLYVEFC